MHTLMSPLLLFYSKMGLIPLANNYPIATKFLEQFSSKDILKRIMFREELKNTMIDLWELIVNHPYKSRSQSALPKSLAAAIKAVQEGIHQSEIWQSARLIEELNQHGKCLDNIRYGKSSIPSAGRGAFATRLIPG